MIETIAENNLVLLIIPQLFEEAIEPFQRQPRVKYNSNKILRSSKKRGSFNLAYGTTKSKDTMLEIDELSSKACVS